MRLMILIIIIKIVIIKELFYRARKINISVVFITQSYFRALKDARLNSTQ